MKLAIQSFKGISPKTNPRYLADGAAQIALNVEAFGQSLKPMKGLGAAVRTLVKSGTIQSLYRFSQDYAGDDNYWFHWASDVNVCRSQIAGDVSEWTFYTGDGYPKATYNTIALQGSTGAYPVTSRRLGLPAPETALTATVKNPTPKTEPAKLTLTEAQLAQISSAYGVKVSTNNGSTWATAAVAGTAAPAVTLTTANVAAVTTDYGVYVSIDGGVTRAHCPITGDTTATAPSVTISSAYIGTISPFSMIYVSTNGGSTFFSGNLGGETVTATAVAAAINLFAGSLVSAVVSGTSVVVTALATGSSCVLVVKLGSTTLPSATGTDGSVVDAATKITNSINTNAKINGTAIATATNANGAVTVTATSSGASVKLKVWWGSAENQSLTANGTPPSATTVAAAIDALAGVAAEVDGTGVAVTSDAKGADATLKVKWGDETGKSLSATGSTEDLGTLETRVYTYTFINKEADLTVESQPWSADNMESATVEVYPYRSVASVTLTTTHISKITAAYGVKVSVDNGTTWLTAAISATPPTAAQVATAVSALSSVSAEANGSNVVVTSVDTGSTVKLIVKWSDASGNSLSASGSSAAVTLTGFAAPPSGEGWSYTGMRIYRATAGTFLFVAEVGKVTSYVDTKSADELGEPCPSTNWAPPVETLKGLINLPNGMMAGFSGRDVYFCEPYRPYAWPVDYMQSVDYPVVGLGRMDTTLAVLTAGTPYFMQGSAPGYVTVVKSDIEQACVSKRSIVSMGGAVLYASPDGLIALTPGGSKNLTEDILSRDDWQAMLPSTIHAYSHDNKYVAFHSRVALGGTAYTGFVVDLASGQFIRHNLVATAGYADLRNDKLFLVDTSKQVVPWGTGALLTGYWKSKKFSLSQITGFACAQVEAEDYTGLKAIIYRDGAKHSTQLSGDVVASSTAPRLHGRYPFRLEAKQGRDWEIYLVVTREIFNVVLAQSMSEVASA